MTELKFDRRKGRFKAMTVKIMYTNGNEITEQVNYLHIGNGFAYYTVDSKAHSVVQGVVKVNLEYVITLDVTKAGDNNVAI